jgi:hypothetical protein
MYRLAIASLLIAWLASLGLDQSAHGAMHLLPMLAMLVLLLRMLTGGKTG